MENLERELEFAKMENVLLRLHRAFQNFKRAGNEDSAHELGVGLADKIQTYLAMLPGKVESLRQKVLSMSNATREDRVKVLDEIKKVESDRAHWEDILNDIEVYVGIKEAPHKLEWWEEKPKRPDVTPLPKAEKVMTDKPTAPGFKIVKKNPTATASEIQLLVSIADKLDNKGLVDEATIIDNIIRLAIKSNIKVLQWQQNYNKKNNLKPGMPGFLTPDGLMGPATQQAMNKEKQLDFTKQVYDDPRKQPFDANKIPSRGSAISNRVIKTASKNDFIKALKDNDMDAAEKAIVGLSGDDFGMTHEEFRKLTSKLSARSRGGIWYDDVMDDLRKMLGVGKNVTLNPATHNPLTGQPYSGAMPKGFCPECGKKLVMRYPGGDPEDGPARLRCPQYHHSAEPCELCPHFFHQDKCKECDCYSSWGTKEQQEEEHEMMKKLYGDDYDQNPDPQDFLP